MRLIDADALKKNYTNTFAEKYGVKGAEMFRDIVNQMPTAYDTEVVVAELEEKKYWEYDDEGFSIGKVVSIGDAITIVRKGGAK